MPWIRTDVDLTSYYGLGIEGGEDFPGVGFQYHR